MQLKEILELKGDVVHTIGPRETLADVVRKLVAWNCGSLVVCDGDRMVGIITERDILRASADLSQPLEAVAVESRMTAEVVTGTPDDRVQDVMGLLTEKRIRHLPVLQDGRLVGMISIGDVVKAQHDRLTMENHYLKNYIQS
jgi:CBS domain-containing protein